MTLDDIGEEALATAASAVLMTIVVALLERGRRQPGTATSEFVEPSSATFALGLIAFVLPFALTVTTLFVPGPSLVLTVIWGTFCLPGIWMTLSSRRFRIEVTTSGFFARTLFRRRTWIPWCDVTAVRWATLQQAFILKLKDRRTIAVGATMRGLPCFAQQLLSGVPGNLIDPKAMKTLVDAARGNLPELHGT